MNQPFSNKVIYLLKKYSLTALLLFTATFLEMYWAMRSFSEKISSDCLDCSFSGDVNFISIFTSVFLIIVLLILSLIKNVYWKNSIQLLFLITVWFFWNYVIFVDRESSWSTYTFSEEIQYTISYSVLPILILSAVTAFILHNIHKNISKPL